MNIENIENLDKFGIYSITNKINNKKYIGSTAKSFKQRFKQHISKLKNGGHANKHLQASYNKYGPESFDFEILEIVDSSENIRDIEKLYIDKFDCVNNGYNENPDPNCSPMLNGTTQDKVSEGMKNWWKDLKNTLSEKEFLEHCKKYGQKNPWNKGIKMTEEQTKNMKKPKVNGVSEKMKEVHKNNSKLLKDRSPYYLVYDLNGNWVNTFWCLSDLIEYSKSEYNTLPVIISKGKERFGKSLTPSRIDISITENKPYKGLFFKRVPKDRKLPCANGMNSWKAEKPIMSQAEGILSEGAETTGEVQSS